MPRSKSPTKLNNKIVDPLKLSLKTTMDSIHVSEEPSSPLLRQTTRNRPNTRPLSFSPYQPCESCAHPSSVENPLHSIPFPILIPIHPFLLPYLPFNHQHIHLSIHNNAAHIPRVLTSCTLASGATEEDLAKYHATQRKLLLALVFAAAFMVVEVAGGIYSGSLAIITDAAHLLSDVSGFGVSALAALWASRASPNFFSYGYHRLEVLGALGSILSVWMVTGILLYQAVARIFNPEPVNGKVMFILALIGVGVNVGLLWILGGHHHHHGQSCGGGGGGDHHHGHGHSHSHGGAPCSGDHSDDHSHSHSHLALGEDIEANNSNFTLAAHRSAAAVAVVVPSSSSESDKSSCHCCPPGESDTSGAAVGEDGRSLLLPGGPTSTSDGGVEAVQTDTDSHSHDHSHSHDQHNINVRGAVIHIIGDFLQSIGVAIAGALIWWHQGDTRWALADPICTFLFAGLVLWTTFAIMRDIADVLMERVPRGLSIDKIYKELAAIEGVDDVHDLHVWSLTPGIPLLCAHVELRAGASRTVVLKQVVDYCMRLGIEHSTIQLVEDGWCPCDDKSGAGSDV